MTPIVAATDLSAASQPVADRAACLARLHGAPLTLLHALVASAYDDPRRAGAAAAAQASRDQAGARLHALAAELQQRHGVRADERIEAGFAAADIVTRVAEQLDAGLIVTGMRGSGQPRGVIVGSTAERVARSAKRPVLMVRQAVRAPYRRALVPVDFSPWSLDAVQLADRVAPDAQLLLMHALELPEPRRRLLGRAHDPSAALDAARAEAQRELAALAARTGLPGERLRLLTPTGGDPWTVIAQQEREQDCDLIVMGRQGRHALQELMLGSTTSRVLADCRSDVLLSVLATAGS